jgi:hypothetical protein
VEFLRRNKSSIVIILAICLILILPAILYQYPYPNHSDDTPRHLQVIQRVVDGQGYSDLWDIRNAYAGPAFIGLIIKILHTDPYWSFYVFHYLALIAMIFTIWFFTYKVFNRTAANLALPLVVLCTPPFLWYFYNGVIFNMVNLFIFGLMGILALVYWLKTRRPYYAAISIILFAIVVLFHSASGLYLAVGIGFFLICYTLINAKKRAWGEVRRLGVYTAVFCVICGALALTLSPEVKQLVGAVYNGVAGGAIAPARQLVSIQDFISSYSNIVILSAFVISMIVIWRRKIQISVGMGILASLIFVLLLNVFVFKVIEPTRGSYDLAMVISLAGAGALGVALQRVKRFKTQYYAFMVVAIVALALPMVTFWNGYRCAVWPADQEAIAYMETLQGGSYSVSTQIQPSIYSLFLQGKNYTPAGGDYVIYRSDPMTGETDPRDGWCQIKGNVSTEADYAGLPVIGEFNDGEIRIVIYKGG